jgi:hypothetical protein
MKIYILTPHPQTWSTRQSRGFLLSEARIGGLIVWQLVEVLDELKHIVWQQDKMQAIVYFL